MKNIPAYFDGNTVRTLDAYPFVKNQRLIITILDDTEKETQDINHRLALLAELQKRAGRLPKEFASIKALRGSLSKYANPNLIEKEQDAWQTAAREKHGIR